MDYAPVAYFKKEGIMKSHRGVLIVFALFCLFIGSAVLAQGLPMTKPEAVGLSSERLNRLSTNLEAAVKKGRFPGVVALIARRGKIAYFESFGMQDIEKNVPMKKDSIFRIYSMTKPIVSVAAMTLWEEGRFFLSDPVAKYLPEFKDMKIGVEGTYFKTVAAQNPIRIHDLLRHTSGITYGVFGNSTVKRMYRDVKIWHFDHTLTEMCEKLGKLPLLFEPGTKWDYGMSTDVVGRLIEVLTGKTLDVALEERIFQPLGMKDSGFYVKPDKLNRVAEPFKGKKDPPLLDVTKPPKFLSGGGGSVSTTGDYARFAQMLLNGGQLQGKRILSRKTIAYMASDHIGPIALQPDLWYLPGPGYGFGLGFGVRLENGRAAQPGSVGEFTWEDLITVLMIQNPLASGFIGNLFRTMVYQAIID
jgi:CubicO group peptidase (beta-lactamase class C family)